MTKLFTELKRRNVFRVAAAYAIVGWMLIQVADIVQPAFLLPDWFTRVVTVLVLLGFPLAILFSWAFELTPEGIRKTADVEPAESVTNRTGRKIDRMIIGALALVVALLLADRFFISPGGEVAPEEVAAVEEPFETSIAVMPFVNMSSDPEQEYFSDGISEEILNVLAGVDGLQVTSRSSTFALKGQNLDIPAIAERLGVNHVLEGSVRKAGNQVRITAQLIQVDNDVHLWSDTYDRTLEDIFAIQDEISTSIVDALKEELGLSEASAAIDPRQLTSPDAYAAYLRGNHLINQRTRSSLESAESEYRSAILLDPDFARAHAQLAVTLLLLRNEQYGETTVTEALAQAKPHIDRAMALDSGAAEVQAAAGYYAWITGDHEAAGQYWNQALEINPSYATIFNWRYRMLSQDLGRTKEAFEALAQARKLDPLSGPTLFNYLRELAVRGRNDEALQAVEQSRALGPLRFYRALASYHELSGEHGEAILAYLNVLKIDPRDEFRVRLLFANLVSIGLDALAEEWELRSESWIEYLRGNIEGSLQLARQRAAQDPASLQARGDLAISLAAAGRVDEAAVVLRELWSMSEGRVTSPQGVFSELAGLAAIYVFSKTGDSELVEQITDELRLRFRESRDLGRDHFQVDENEGMFLVLTGEAERGIAMLQRAAENGGFVPRNVAFLEPVYAHPGFAEIVNKVEKRQAGQQQILLAVLCVPGNSFEAIAPVPEDMCRQYR